MDYNPQKHKIRSVDQLPSALRSRAGWAEFFDARLSKEPHVHQIEPTNHCPYTCIMCPRSHKMTRELGFMDMGLYQKIIDEVATYSEPVRSMEIELFHFGESLLHPKMSEMVSYGSKYNLKMVLSINAPHLTFDKTDELLTAKAHKIILSLDGYDAASYRAIRGKVADFGKAQENIDYLLKQHSIRKSNTKIVVRMIMLKENMEHGDEFRKKWQARGVTVELREFFPWTENDLENLGDYDRYPPYMPCPFPWQYVVVQWDGSVVPCCRDYNSENIMGNVSEKTIRELWNDEKYKSFRKDHACDNLEGNRICTECMTMYYNDGCDDREIS